MLWQRMAASKTSAPARFMQWHNTSKSQPVRAIQRKLLSVGACEQRSPKKQTRLNGCGIWISAGILRINLAINYVLNYGVHGPKINSPFLFLFFCPLWNRACYVRVCMV